MSRSLPSWWHERSSFRSRPRTKNQEPRTRSARFSVLGSWFFPACNIHHALFVVLGRNEQSASATVRCLIMPEQKATYTTPQALPNHPRPVEEWKFDPYTGEPVRK